MQLSAAAKQEPGLVEREELFEPEVLVVIAPTELGAAPLAAWAGAGGVFARLGCHEEDMVS